MIIKISVRETPVRDRDSQKSDRKGEIMKKRKLLLVWMLGLVLALSACGGGDSSSDDSGKKTEASDKDSKKKDKKEKEEKKEEVDPDHVKDDNGFERDARGYIMAYEGEDESIEIPAKIGDMEITGIGFSAFANKTDIVDVKIPDSVLIVDNNAFEGCTGLATVDFGQGLTEIGSEAFSGCISLSDVELPDSCSFVGAQAFFEAGAGSFTGSPAEYGERCFAGSTFTSFTFPAGSDLSAANLFYEAQLMGISLPSDLKELGESAFASCKNLKDLVLPDSLRTIGPDAFSNMDFLPELILPEGIEELPAGMTNGTCLDVLIIPKSVKKIGTGAVYDAAIVELQNPEVEIEIGGVTGGYVYIKDAAKFVFPTTEDEESVITAGHIYLDGVYDPAQIQGDFYSSVTVETQVQLPADATMEESDALDKWLVSIGYEELAWMSGITEEFIPESTTDIDVEGTCITGYHGSSDTLTLSRYVRVEEDGSWWLPYIDEVKTKAFAGSSVKTIYNPGSINIQSQAFAGCDSLTDLWLTGSALSDIGEGYYADDALVGLPDNVTIHLPECLKALEPEKTLAGVGMPQTAKIEYYSYR